MTFRHNYQLGKFEYPDMISIPTYKPNYKGNAKQIKKAVDAIKHAERPIFYLGGGIILSESSELVRELISFTKIPSVETLMARGALRHDDPLLLGMIFEVQ